MKRFKLSFNVQMIGELALYETEKRLAVFISSPTSPTDKVLVFVGGLTDGFLCVPYLNKLARELHSIDYAFAQPLLSSSYRGYGRSSVKEDVEELKLLAEFLKGRGFRLIVLMGHSTGAVDAVHFGKEVDAIILQGPVSDRLYWSEHLFKDNPEALVQLKNEAADKYPLELMSWMIDEYAALNCERFLSLTGEMTDDDVFTPGAVHPIWQKACEKVLVLLSEMDEFVTRPVEDYVKFFRGLTENVYVVKGANHACTEAADEVVAKVIEFLL